ncbi:MAG: universal stress protein [Caldimicrobium sp.]|nr:universal stress protein [Caldimicrobium sp.]MCX7613521.1 universal stress protein [Caldimicrobium sp.]MDW8182555.1 universal stress protein [Caldimicrobium sp.]
MVKGLRKILLCIDGEIHSEKAKEFALDLAEKFKAKVVCLYVVDAYPKRFTNEIYAINREECRKYLDNTLAELGQRALSEFSLEAEKREIPYEIKMRFGLPKEEILKELREEGYDLLVMGKKKFKGYLDRVRSFNLPQKVLDDIPIPVLFVVSEVYEQ